jgi:hypothetical protein
MLALVLDKLFAEAFLRVGCSLEGIEGNIEAPLAVRADANGWHGPSHFVTLRLRWDIVSRLQLSLGVFASRCAPPVFEPYDLRGVGGISGWSA